MSLSPVLSDRGQYYYSTICNKRYVDDYNDDGWVVGTTTRKKITPLLLEEFSLHLRVCFGFRKK